MAIRAVICDIGGVLLRWASADVHKGWENRLGLGTDTLPDRLAQSEANAKAVIGHISVTEFWQQFGADCGLGGAEITQLQQDFYQSSVPNVAMITFLRTLRPRYKTALLSDAWLDARERMTHVFKFDSLVDLMVFSSEIGITKSDPIIFEHTLQQLGVQPYEAVFIDDTQATIALAQRLGLYAVHFVDTQYAITETTRILEQFAQ